MGSGKAQLGCLAAAVMLCAPIFYRVPQALLSQLLPNDYVYRFSTSVTYDGKTFSGETFGGCRGTRDGWPDWARFGMGDEWMRRKWSIGINVQLPEGRFLLVPDMWSCAATSFLSESWWKGLVGLAPTGISREADKYPAIRLNHPVLLFDNDVRPTTIIGMWTTKGAAEQGLTFSPITLAPALWYQVDAHLARGPGSPWVAPVIEGCITNKWGCLGGRFDGVFAKRLTVAEAMEVPEFKAWADATEHVGISVGFPSKALGNRFFQRRAVVMRPNWKARAWEVSDSSSADVAILVGRSAWKEEIVDPKICFAADRCVQMGTNRTVVDWPTGQVLLVMTGGGGNWSRPVVNGDEY